MAALSDPRDVALDARKVADQAVTEGVSLKYVERMRRALYEAADAVAVAVRERDQARDALQLLYDYTVALEEETAAWFASRSYAKVPDGGREAGAKARAALAGGETVNQKPKGHTA